ncbi:protein MOR1 [Tanacetum coccineum]
MILTILCLAAITSFNEQVIAPQEVDIPGWSEKNVQVQPQVIEVVSHIASTATKFPKKCVVLCIAGICERVVDIKTRAQAMKCLTTFSEAMGTGFIFERTSKIMKEHKNPKVLSEGLLWMVFAVDDFGVAHLKLKDVFDFCKDIGLQSSAAATTIIATIKLIGVLHKLVGSDMKAFLSDVMPALLRMLNVEVRDASAIWLRNLIKNLLAEGTQNQVKDTLLIRVEIEEDVNVRISLCHTLAKAFIVFDVENWGRNFFG